MNLLSLVGPRLDNIYQIRRKCYYSSGWNFFQSKQGLSMFSRYSWGDSLWCHCKLWHGSVWLELSIPVWLAVFLTSQANQMQLWGVRLPTLELKPSFLDARDSPKPPGYVFGEPGLHDRAWSFFNNAVNKWLTREVDPRARVYWTRGHQDMSTCLGGP